MEDTKKTGSALSLKERQRQERLELILDAAEKFLVEKGYHEMVLDEIAAYVGIAKATIYLHFSSKEELVFALLKRSLTASYEELKEIVTQPLPVKTRLEQIMRQAYRHQRQQRSQLIFTFFTGANLSRETIAKELALREHMQKMLSLFSQVMEEGQQNGELNPAIPSHLLQTTFMALMMQPKLDKMTGQDPALSEEQAGQVIQIFFQGVANGQK